MKKILLSAAFIMAAFTINAQTTVWSDNFDDEDISDWTLTDVDGDTKNWGDLFQVGDGGGGFITPVSLISRSWENNVPLTPDNWAVSPAIDLTAIGDNHVITLSWLRQTNEAFPQDKYTVYVGTSNDIDDLFESTVTFTETPGEGEGIPTTKTLDLSSFAGETIYIAFRHYDSTDKDFISIDDVVISDDGVAGLNDVLSSNLSVYPNPVNNIINISNTANILLEGAQIIDINGRTVKTVSLGGVAEAQINISELSAGMYMMNISSDQGTITKKIVKE